MATYMAQKLCRTVILIILAAFVAAPVLCQKRSRTRKPNQKPTPTNKGPLTTTSESGNYTSAPFNLNLTNLPPNYLGHDFKNLWEALWKVSRNTEKDEFETTEDYRKRIANTQPRTLVNGLTTDSILAFAYSPQDVKYDADLQRLVVIVRLQEEILSRDRPERWLSLDYQEKTGDSYVGQNAYGAKVIVEREYSDSWYLLFTNHASLGAIKHRDKPYDDSPLATQPRMYDAFVNKLEMDIPAAKAAKQDLRLLFICKPMAPWASKDTSHIRPTLQKPKAVSWTQHRLHVELVDIWYYDFATGKVYSKQK